jgi:dipeptidase E
MNQTGGNQKRLLLISNSTLHGSGYLDHAEKEIREFLRDATRIIFIPFALYDRQAYATRARERFLAMGCTLLSVHEVSNPQRAIAEAEVIFVGGGNTFRLLKALYDFDLLTVIRQKVEAGMPYIGSSAGAIVAGPSLKTTKDMPIVQPPSFDALGLVDFQISPHYLDPDPSSTHMGETQEERILQFLEENTTPVAGLREGAMLRVEDGSITLKGSTGARIFRRGENPVEVSPGMSLNTRLRDPTPAELSA